MRRCLRAQSALPANGQTLTRQQRSGGSAAAASKGNDRNHDTPLHPPPHASSMIRDRGKGSSALLLVLRCWIRFERFLWFKLVAGGRGGAILGIPTEFPYYQYQHRQSASSLRPPSTLSSEF